MALPGPPLVMIQNRSKAMIELIEVSSMISSSIGRSQGSVILKNRSTAPGAVDARRAMQVLGHRLQRRQDQKGGERCLVPDLDQGDEIERGRAVGEPGDRLADQRRDRTAAR